MKVLKFGGTSVASAENINKVIDIVKNTSENSKVAVVVSALGGLTDTLIQAGKKAEQGDESFRELFLQIEKRHIDTVRELIPVQNQSGVIGYVKKQLNNLESIFEGVFLIQELSDKSLDRITGFGELLSSYIIKEAMLSRGLDVIRKDSREIIITNDVFTNAAVDFEITQHNIERFFETRNNTITIFPGFVSRSSTGEDTTLGRGGSDYTASIIAASIKADALEIWTDVSGVYTAHPKFVNQAKPIPHISYHEAMELSHFGAKVIYPPTIQPVLKIQVPIWIKNTFDAKANGTLITSAKSTDERYTVKGITHIENVTLITLDGSGMVGIPGFSKRLFEALSQEKINVSLITQASSEHSICIAINDKDAERAKEIVDITFEYEIAQNKVNPLQVESNLAIIALVGDNMKNHQGISGKMFSSLGKNNVNIRAIAQGASEKNISAVIKTADVKKALNTLHEAFFDSDLKPLNLYITGVGNVGGKLIEQIKNQKDFLQERLNLKVNIIGLSNSRKMVFDEDGINIENWQSLLDKGEKASLEGFLNKAKEFNFRNSIFVDNTANYEVSNWYGEYLRNSIAVVTCNKIACSSEYKNYENLKRLSRKYNAPFLFETNVGAGLPIIDTLQNLIASGDRVRNIKAVLSGSLNFIFNNFNSETSFHDVVVQAGEEGYTEPDPRIDLSGVDVMRKILILARESGFEMELDDIKNNGFLPQKSLDANSVDDFYNTLKEETSHFEKLVKEAVDKNCQLKYVAKFDEGKASVGLEFIPKDHPFYNLEGKDNIVLFFTERYPEQPLLIKGAGAGAEVTASGLFADIIRVGRA